MNIEWNLRRGGCSCDQAKATKLPKNKALVATVANVCAHGMNDPATVVEMFKVAPSEVTFAAVVGSIINLWSVAVFADEEPEHVFAYMIAMENGDSVLPSRDDQENEPHFYWNMCDTAESDQYSEPLFNYGFHTRISVLEYVLSELSA
jgi:hypothetical protein